MAVVRLDYDDILDGLRQLADRIEKRGITGATIRIVGGAALRIAYFDRATTVDIDAEIRPAEAIQPIIDEIAIERGWPSEWLNDAAARAGFFPRWGRDVAWTPLLQNTGVTIEVASVEALLVMKLNAHAKRAGRDAPDVVNLLTLTDIRTVEQAEELLGEYFPGDGLSDRTVAFLEGVFAEGLPDKPAPPGSRA
ncbi:MAG: hypothetical protein V4479_10670 [Actinomycetota bacterium]